MTYALWIVHGLLAALFLWAGGIKLLLPLEQLTGPVMGDVMGDVRSKGTFGQTVRRG